MAQNSVFISFLGTGNYVACNYRLGHRTSANVRFIQSALLELVPSDGMRALVFTTPKAAQTNLPALQEECRQRSLPAPESVAIPDGGSEEELWEIFRIVGDAIPECSRIIFDITHSFRSLPLLMTLLLNYLRITKRVEVEACYYGAFEKLGFLNDVQNMPLDERNAPVFDLTPFFALNDWAQAISHYLDYGRADNLVTLIREPLAQKLRESGGSDPAAHMLRGVVNNVEKFSLMVHTADCPGIYAMRFATGILAPLDQVLLQSGSQVPLPQMQPLLPVLQRVRDVFSCYEDASMQNGVRAAWWCVQHDLVPQGFTILQETIVSLECSRLQQHLDRRKWNERARREFVSNLLGLKSQKKGFDKIDDEIIYAECGLSDAVLAWNDGFLGAYISLTQLRNMVNHGGTGHDNYKPGSMLKRLRQSVADVARHYSITLPADALPPT
ncbi:MAG: TIGR02221 family CRISPR-associated protein [Actinomycetaceae bacterium]|nr:TIGR02221 family CRISPR-associated protein [Actinomycetaceae bacterium]